MTNFWLLLLPLGAALLYVAAVLSLKRAADLGVGIYHSTLLANLIVAGAFQGLLIFGGSWPPLSLWWQPVIVALLFISGQVWTLLSLQRGDVSVATPILGLKIILVALFTMLLLSQKLDWHLWLAAALTTIGIALLSHSSAHKAGTGASGTVISALLAAISLSLFDVLVQKWSPIWGIGRFLPVAIGFVGFASLIVIPFCPSPLSALPRSSKRWLWLGSALFALQSLIFVSSIAYFGTATAMNVIYSSRGVWSVIGVALFGHWFHSSEKTLGVGVLRWRFAGATLMFAAIVLVLI